MSEQELDQLRSQVESLAKRMDRIERHLEKSNAAWDMVLAGQERILRELAALAAAVEVLAIKIEAPE